MEELQDLLKELEQTLHDRLHAIRGGALHDVKNFHSANDFVELLEESENDFNYYVEEMENVDDYNMDEYQRLAEAAKNKFQTEVINLIDTLDFYNLEEKAKSLAVKNKVK
ncbi:hypothetical protein SMGD1_0200 [Sulfurimonas gotlandica GD1]|uniref:Uncharacterized protein n=1 Tax=Sulfurimonas gotlandica (strain DSM 19862 / JCM 16533 / GD1) TaxID=929558 RepID=B6BLR7_SULGG|nr:hypothetical protein [Sulfurimonas gotlandica]EDZ62211.1 hypothetical protein CBGD1_2793 [Sulfurimonas gotlandica GD1]EHP28727.1 hypothetical protein SMGD1_0200 [Sulfurimonas gotlandica GD1]